ncbi:MAG: preprotein translocase subunit SecG [Bacteroidales bacterium]|nr:preprotein translocase subunit SecG [Bacteroidales bacterium]
MGIYVFISIIVIIACVLQVMVVLVQNSKGGGLAANFTSTGQSMGVRKTADFLEKATWTLAAIILLLSIVSTAAIPHGVEEEASRIQDQIENAVDPTAIPNLPTAIPDQGSGNQQED